MTIRLTTFLIIVLNAWFTVCVAQTIPITLAHISPIADGYDLNKAEGALEYFFGLINEQCQMDLHYRVEHLPTWDMPFERFRFDPLPQQSKMSSTQTSYFQYFQHDLWQLLNSSTYASNDYGVKILIVPNLDGYCGFAFPEIQFTAEEDYPSHQKVQRLLTNSLLINYQQAGCGSYNRLVAHELAHIFIQDNPAHYCPNEAGELRPCPEDNLLSVFRTVRPNPVGTKKPGGHNPFPSGGIGEFNDPMIPQKLPSIGTHILPVQCRAIAKTVQKLVGQPQAGQ